MFLESNWFRFLLAVVWCLAAIVLAYYAPTKIALFKDPEIWVWLIVPLILVFIGLIVVIIVALSKIKELFGPKRKDFY